MRVSGQPMQCSVIRQHLLLLGKTLKSLLNQTTHVGHVAQGTTRLLHLAQMIHLPLAGMKDLVSKVKR